jgi:HK97 family phage prohead protease
MPQPESRRLVTGALEWRADSDGVTVEGYASTFDQPYDMGWYTERVAAGAFAKTLSETPDVRFLVNHDGLPLARTGRPGVDGTLDLSEDTTGLHVRSVLDASDPDVQSLIPKMKRGDLDQMSFGFRTIRDDWSPDYDTRTLRELSLDGGDVSIVTYPANPTTSIGLRSAILDVDHAKLRELHRELRAGKTLSAATTSQLTSALESLNVADTNMDDALSVLGDLLGVNSDDSDDEDEEQDAARKQAIALQLRDRRALARKLAIRA